MAKNNDYSEVSPERRAELHKRAQEVKRESRIAREEKLSLPHLLSFLGGRRCSVCKMPFPPDTQPSVNKAFADHVRKAHRPGQTTEDSSQAALRIVREATENK